MVPRCYLSGAEKLDSQTPVSLRILSLRDTGPQSGNLFIQTQAQMRKQTQYRACDADYNDQT